MNLLTAGSFRWPHPPTENERDWNVLQQLRRDWSRIDVLVKTNALESQHFERDGIAVHYLPSRLSGPAGTVGFVVSATRAAIDIHRRAHVALFSASDPIAGIAGYELKRRADVPCLMHLQGELLAPPSAYGSRVRRWALQSLTCWVGRRVDVVRALYPQQVEQLVAAGVPRDRIELVRNRCDTDLCAPERWHGQRDAMRRLLGVDDRWVMLFVGSLLPIKGVDVALRALPLVLRQRPDATLVIAGEGPERRRLARLTAQLGIDHHVRFCGRVPHGQVPALLAAADVCLFPSRSEASPRVVLEAAAMARPIVASAVGGVPDIVVDRESGLLVPMDDPCRLAQAIMELAQHEPLGVRLGQAARATILTKFEYQKNLDELRRLYRRVAHA